MVDITIPELNLRATLGGTELFEISFGGVTFKTALSNIITFTNTWTANKDANSNNIINLGALNTHTVPGGTSTLALLSDNLGVFTSTTSLQLAGVISDETGSGALVFNNTPTLLTPTIASFTNAQHDHANTAAGGQFASTKLTDTSVIVRTDQANTFGDFVQTFADDQLFIQNPAATFEYQIIAVAITADRTVTLPLLTANDTFVTEAFTQTLTNKTLTTPTIGDFTNAQHDHANTAGGGQLLSTSALSDSSNIARDSNNLSFFSATTSLQLAGVISDETGSGALVFGSSPTLGGTVTFDNQGIGADPTLTSNSDTQRLELKGELLFDNLGTGENPIISSNSTTQTLRIDTLTLQFFQPSLVNPPKFVFIGHNTALAERVYSEINTTILDPIQGQLSAELEFSVEQVGLTKILALNSSKNKEVLVRHNLRFENGGAGANPILEAVNAPTQELLLTGSLAFNNTNVSGTDPVLVAIASATKTELSLTGDFRISNNLILGNNIQGSNNTTIIEFIDVPLAVNHIRIESLVTGFPPSISSDGGDDNIDLDFATKGTGKIQILSDMIMNSHRFETDQGTTVTVPSSGNLTLGTGGNIFPIDTDTTSFNLKRIAIDDWQNGSVIILTVSGSASLDIDDVQGTASEFRQIKLINGTFSQGQDGNITLALIFDEWLEISRGQTPIA